MALTDSLRAFVEFEFLRNALLGCLLLNLTAAPLGLFLSYRRMSLSADALSHAILPGVALGFWFSGLSLPALAFGGLIAGFAIVCFSTFFSRISVLKEDSTLAVTYLLALASGVLLVSLKGTSVDLFHFLFGHLFGIDQQSLILLAALSLVILMALFFLFEPLKILTVDEEYARFLKVPVLSTHIVFMTLVVLNLVISFQVLGTLLSVGQLIIPAVTSRLFFRSFASQWLGALGIGWVASAAGLVMSYQMDWPSGPTLILCSGVFFILGLFKKSFVSFFSKEAL